MGWTQWLGLLGPLSIAFMLALLGLLSRKLGRVTRAAPYYMGYFVAAAFVMVGVMARVFNLISGLPGNSQDHLSQLILETGFPALGITIGAILAWRYWSWLLAERD